MMARKTTRLFPSFPFPKFWVYKWHRLCRYCSPPEAKDRYFVSPSWEYCNYCGHTDFDWELHPELPERVADVMSMAVGGCYSR